MKAEQVLEVRAGPEARRTIAEHGLHADQVRVMVGASGGPKWLVLNGLDRYLASEFFAGCTQPIHLLGSSIGTWRFACYAQADPVAAIQRFEDAYLEQTYSDKPTAAEISDEAWKILDHVLGQEGSREILEHPFFYSNIVAVRARHLVARDHPALMWLGLGLGALANMVHRRLLHFFFERAVFARPGASARFHRLSDLATRILPLHRDNLPKALMASASIPGVLQPVRQIPGAPDGTYYDGGVTDYHFDIPFHDSEGIVFYPHFYGHIKPGWFDKALHWRGHTAEHYANVLLVAPSAEFVAGLPHGRIPDRKDFLRMDNAERLRCWKQVIGESRRLGDAFQELHQRQGFAEIARPM